jgi:DNA polymerase III alpha subunit (gram-positive type)
MPRKMTGQHRDCGRLLIPRQMSSFEFTPDDRPDAVCGAPWNLLVKVPELRIAA